MKFPARPGQKHWPLVIIALRSLTTYFERTHFSPLFRHLVIELVQNNSNQKTYQDFGAHGWTRWPPAIITTPMATILVSHSITRNLQATIADTACHSHHSRRQRKWIQLRQRRCLAGCTGADRHYQVWAAARCQEHHDHGRRWLHVSVAKNSLGGRQPPISEIGRLISVSSYAALAGWSGIWLWPTHTLHSRYSSNITLKICPNKAKKKIFECPKR